jgi:PKD repeat protein
MYEYAEDGVYTVSLTVNESDGDSDTMTMADYISVTEVSQIEYIWLEAEDAGILTPDFEIVSDTSASNGKYIQIPEGVGFRAHDGEASYNISINTSGNYTVWGCKIAAKIKDNFFFVQIDDGTEYLWTLALSDNWQWDAVNHWGSGGEFDPEIDPAVFTLSAGEHTLRILQREDGAKLDKLLITNDMSYVPPYIEDTTQSKRRSFDLRPLIEPYVRISRIRLSDGVAPLQGVRSTFSSHQPPTSCFNTQTFSTISVASFS